MPHAVSRSHKNSTGVKQKIQGSSRKKTAKTSKNGFSTLRSKVTPILKPYAIRISVFGSFARGEATSSSDIDLLIALKPAEARPILGLIEFIKLEQELEEKLGRDVDLITEEELNPRRRMSIEKDKVILYEAK